MVEHDGWPILCLDALDEDDGNWIDVTVVVAGAVRVSWLLDVGSVPVLLGHPF